MVLDKIKAMLIYVTIGTVTAIIGILTFTSGLGIPLLLLAWIVSKIAYQMSFPVFLIKERIAYGERSAIFAD